MSVLKNSDSKPFSPSVEDLLVSDVTVGGDVLDRSLLYQLTQDWKPEALSALKDRVTARVVDYYGALFEGGFAGEKDVEHAKREIDRWFKEWTRLGGRMDYELECLLSDRAYRNVKEEFTPEALSAFADRFAGMEEYRKYVENSTLKGWVHNRCVEHGWDYTRVSDAYKTVDLVQHFLGDYPYYAESNERKLVDDFCAKEPRVSFKMGEDGSESGWSLDNLVVGHDAVGGFIRLKECGRTEDFLAFGDVREPFRTVPFWELPKNERQAVLERMHMRLRYSRSRERSNRSGIGM